MKIARRRETWAVAAVALLGSALLVGLAVRLAWLARGDSRTLVEEAQLAVELERALGYGGLIDDFKNYLLRPEESFYREEVLRQSEAAEALVGRLEALGRGPLPEVRSMIGAYRDHVATVTREVTAGLGTRAIDQVVRYDDGPALAELDRLNSEIRASYDERVRRLVTRTTLGAGATVGFSFAAIALILWLHRRESREMRLRERRERELAKQEDLYEQLKRALDEHAIVAMTDRNGCILYVNDLFCSISGYSEDELLGQDHRLLNSGRHSKAFFRDLWETISSGQTWRGEVCNRTKQGALYWVATTIVPFRDEVGRIDRYIAIRADTTARVRAEQSLRERNHLLGQTLAATPAGILVLDASRKIHLINETGRELLGFAQGWVEEEWPAESRFLDAANLEPLAAVDDPLHRAFFGHRVNRTLFAFRFPGREAPGFVEVTCVPLEGASSGPQLVLSILDVTVQENGRRHGLRKNRLEAIGQMAGSVAHDFNNLLATLLNATELVELELDPQRQNADLALIRQTLDRARGLTARLLKFARSGEVTEGETDLETVFEGLALLVTRVVPKSVACVFENKAGAARLPGATSQVESVVLNLIVNARDAITASGRGDRIEVRACVEAAAAEGDCATLRLEVADNGPGMSPRVEARAREPFFSTKPEGEGTGLGLAIVEGYVEQAGGRFAIDSSPGHGTCVKMWLPLAEGAAG